jgi:hypothetical protein
MNCKSCNQFYLKGEPDPCFGYLPGVDSACCGHGYNTGYVKFVNGKVIKFSDCSVEQTYGNSGTNDSMFADRTTVKGYQ